MKPRKWVIVIACCVAMLGGANYWASSAFEKNGNIRRLLISAVSASTESEFAVGKISIGFLSVYLKNVSMTMGGGFYKIDIHDIKIGFSLRKLIKYHGDITRSISKMILIRPEAVISLSSTPQSALPRNLGKGRRVDVFSLFNAMPVDQFFIRDGTVRILGKTQSGIPAGEQLSGSIKAQGSGVAFDLHGSMASRRKNFSITGFIAKENRQTRVSIRLDKAHISKSLRWAACSMQSGSIDGVCELSLPYPASLSTMDLTGWVRLRDGVAVIEGVDAPLRSLSFSTTLTNTLCRIDSLHGEWNGITCKGSGAWNIASDDDTVSAITLHIEGIRPEIFMQRQKTARAHIVRGNGWVVAKVAKKRASAEKSVTCSAGGISIYGIPALASIKATVERGQLTVDSCILRCAAVSAKATGIVNYVKIPIAYSCSYFVKVDSLSAVASLSGRRPIRLRGTLHGLGGKPHFDAVIGAANVQYRGAVLDFPEISISGDGLNHIQFDCSQAANGSVRVSGSIDSCMSKLPFVRAIFSVGPEALRQLFAATASPLTRIADSSRISGKLSGNAEEFEASGQFVVRCRPIQGVIPFKIGKNKRARSIQFSLPRTQILCGDSSLFFGACGTFQDTMVRLDSFSMAGAVRGFGYIRMGEHSGGAMELFCLYHNLSLPAINTWFFKEGLPVKKGSVSGNSRIYGSHGRISTESELSFRGCSINSFDQLDVSVIIKSRDTAITVLPTVIKKNGLALVTLDTFSVCGTTLRCSGKFDTVALRTVLAGVVPDEYLSGENEIKGSIAGCFKSEKSGLPIRVSVNCPAVTMNSWRGDSVLAEFDIVNNGLLVKRVSFSDSTRLRVTCDGVIPWSAISASHPDSAAAADTMVVRIKASGDLLAAFEHNLSRPFLLPVAGSGRGNLEIEFQSAAGPLRLSKIKGGIPRGTLRVKPYVLQDIKDFSCVISMDQPSAFVGDPSLEASPKVTIDLNGVIDKRPIRIFTTHAIPRGIEPIRLGVLDAGVVEVVTPHHGVSLHLPGLMEPGVTGDIEFAGKAPFPSFAISGPFDKVRISGVWILHGGEFTFPPMKNNETSLAPDPFPLITWDLDLRAVNRKLKYFYDTGTKNRRLMRLVECYLDPISILSLRGRDADHTFKVLGALRSYKGSVFFRRVFDQNFEAGLDFVPQPLSSGNGFDNMPIIWGSAEGLSEKNRLDRIKLTLFTRDSITGALSEKGRFHDIRFKVSSDVEEIPGESELSFLAAEGKRVASVEGAGELVSTLGEQYVHRFLLQNIQDRLAQSLGLDVINFETSIASNYFNKIYNRQMVNLANDWSYLAFANVGITFGRYVLSDKVFLKWRTELVPVDTFIRPEYTMGFEFQPLNYFMMDFDYGLRPGEKSLERNPKLYMQLRLPIESVRNYFNF